MYLSTFTLILPLFWVCNMFLCNCHCHVHFILFNNCYFRYVEFRFFYPLASINFKSFGGVHQSQSQNILSMVVNNAI